MAWTNIAKPSSSSYTNIAKPSTSSYTNIAKPAGVTTIRVGAMLVMSPCMPLTVSSPVTTTETWTKVAKPT